MPSRHLYIYLSELVAVSGQAPVRLEREALLVRLYDLGELLSGKAAALLGISPTRVL